MLGLISFWSPVSETTVLNIISCLWPGNKKLGKFKEFYFVTWSPTPLINLVEDAEALWYPQKKFFYVYFHYLAYSAPRRVCFHFAPRFWTAALESRRNGTNIFFLQVFWPVVECRSHLAGQIIFSSVTTTVLVHLQCQTILHPFYKNISLLVARKKK